jgi:hypothetical protein
VYIPVAHKNLLVVHVALPPQELKHLKYYEGQAEAASDNGSGSRFALQEKAL